MTCETCKYWKEINKEIGECFELVKGNSITTEKDNLACEKWEKKE